MRFFRYRVEEQAALIEFIDAQPWSSVLSRRVQVWATRTFATHTPPITASYKLPLFGSVCSTMATSTATAAATGVQSTTIVQYKTILRLLARASFAVRVNRPTMPIPEAFEALLDRLVDDGKNVRRFYI